MTLPREVAVADSVLTAELFGCHGQQYRLIHAYLLRQDAEIALLRVGCEQNLLHAQMAESRLAAADALLADYADRLERGEPWMHKGAKFTKWIKEIVADMRTHLRDGNTQEKAS